MISTSSVTVMEQKDPEEQHDGDVDQERPNGLAAPPTKKAMMKARANLAAEVNDRENPGPQPHGHVAAGVLDRVPDLVGGHADPAMELPLKLSSESLMTPLLGSWPVSCPAVYPDVRETVAVEIIRAVWAPVRPLALRCFEYFGKSS